MDFGVEESSFKEQKNHVQVLPGETLMRPNNDKESNEE